MTPAELRKAARHDGVIARIISDGCRDYFVEIERGNSAGILRHRKKGAIRFKSLTEVHQLLWRCDVQDIRLVCRVADDETGRPMGTNLETAELRMRRQTH